jgi:mannitol/fructose-specific phosphotransferase system IIA component (Ntr-type)
MTRTKLKQDMSWWKQFKPKSCSVKLKAETKEAALAEIVANMVQGGTLEDGHQAAALRALEERELLASTGVGMTVAIPHVKLAGIDRVACSLSVHPEGLEWAAVDGAPANIFFMVLRPSEAGANHDPAQHLEMMHWIAKLARDSDFRSFALQAKTKTELVNLLTEMSAV